MSETKLDFTADSKVAQNEIDKLTRKVAGLQEQFRQLNDSARRGAKQSSDAQFDLSESLNSVLSKISPLTFAVGAATAAYYGWRTETDKLIDKHDQLARTFTKTLAEAGKLSLAPQMEKWLQGVQGVTREQAMGALSGVLASGETLGDQRAVAIAGEIAKQAPTGIDVEHAGGLAADIADIVGEDVSAADVADLTIAAKQMLRGKTAQFQGPKFQKRIESLKIGGMSGMDALAAAIASAQSEQGAEGLGILADKGRKTPEQRKMMAEVFAPNRLAEIKAQLDAARQADVAQQELSALGKSGLTQTAVLQQAADVVESQGASGLDAQARAEQARRIIMQRAREHGPIMYGAQWLGTGVSQILDAVRTPNPEAELYFSTVTTQQDKAAFGIPGNFGSQAEFWKWQKEMNANLARQTRLMEQEAARGRVNVDAHTE